MEVFMIQKILFVGGYCPFCHKVTRFMDQNNIKDVEIKDIAKDPEARAYLVEKGGKMQVPCLFIDGKALYESNDIIQHLSEQ